MTASQCTKCLKLGPSERMMRFAPNDPSLKRLRDARICPKCVQELAADFRSHNCLACQNTADVLDEGVKMLEEYDRTIDVQVARIIPQAPPTGHNKGCPLA